MLRTGEASLPKAIILAGLLLLLNSCGRFSLGRPLAQPSPAASLPTLAPIAPALATAAVDGPEPTPWPPITPSPEPTSQGRPTLAPSPTATATPPPSPIGLRVEIGRSVQGRPIEAYQFNDGPRQIIFIGGIHGGYEWNSILLAYQAIDHFITYPELIPEEITLHIIPSANPDGQFLVSGKEGRFTAADVIADTVPGRFNANNVDLNRNWDCEWAPTALWRNNPVSGGERPFSEPENVILRDYILARQPELVLFWHSAVNGVFAAGCPDTHQPSLALAERFGQAAGYPVYERFFSYPITGDAGDWLTTQGIPSISVELTTHESLDWSQNLAGMLAILHPVR